MNRRGFIGSLIALAGVAAAAKPEPSPPKRMFVCSRPITQKDLEAIADNTQFQPIQPLGREAQVEISDLVVWDDGVPYMVGTPECKAMFARHGLA